MIWVAPAGATSNQPIWNFNLQYIMDIRSEMQNLIGNFELLKTKDGQKLFDEQFLALSQSLSPEEKKEAGKILREVMTGRRNATKVKRTDIDIKERLGNIQNIISLSYIAEHYFGKDRSWLYQRINNTLVNGKPAAFTQEELTVFANALKDIGSKISDTSLLIH